MSRTIQFKRRQASEIANTVGANGEIIIDITNNTVTVHDGVTLGGHALPNDAYIDGKIADLVDGAPGLLDTLKELADAINDDPNFFSNVQSSITTANANMKLYVDGQISGLSSNTVNTAFVESQVLAANNWLQANDFITLTQAKSYTDTANNWLQANDTSTLVEAKSYTDSSNNYNQLYTDTSNTYNQSYTGAANTALKSYVDGEIVTLNSSISSNLSTAQSYTDTANVYNQTYTNNTVSSANSDMKIYVDTSISALINSAPATLDTLKELADALGDDANFANTILTVIGTKANTSALSNVAFTGDYNNLINLPPINQIFDTSNGAYNQANSANVLAQAAFNQANTGVQTYANSNVVSLLNSFGSNNITTTGNISSGNIIVTGSITSNTVIGNITFLDNTNQTTAYAGGQGREVMIDTNRIDTYTENGSTNRPFKTFAAAILAVAELNPGGTVPYTFVLMGCNINENVDFSSYNFNFITIATTSRSVFNNPVVIGNSALKQLTVRNVEFANTFTITGDGTAQQLNNTSFYDASFSGAVNITAANSVAFYQAAFFSTVVFTNINYLYINGAQFNNDWTIRADNTGAYPIPSNGVTPAVSIVFSTIANNVNFVKGGTAAFVFQPHMSRMGLGAGTYTVPAGWTMTPHSSVLRGTWTNNGTVQLRNTSHDNAIGNVAPTYIGTIGAANVKVGSSNITSVDVINWNTTSNNVVSASLYANVGVGLAQSAFIQANSANILAQAAFDTANTAGNGMDQFARDTANSANVLAQAAFNQANTGSGIQSYANSNVVSLLSSFGSNNITTTGNVTSNNIVANNITVNQIITSSNIVGTSANVTITAGSYVSTFDTSGTATFPGDVVGNKFISTNSVGDEGGEIQLAASANATITNGVVIDSYNDIVRIFEGGGSARGVRIDIAKAPAGVGGELLWKVGGVVDAGTFVTLDNLNVTIPTSNNRGLSVAAVSGSFFANIGAWYGGSGGTGGDSVNNLSVTTTPSVSLFDWNFVAEGNSAQYTIYDKTNNRMYRVTLMIGPAYLNNFISIERLA
jgi:hypothetical protein